MQAVDHTPWMEVAIQAVRDERIRQLEKYGDQSGRPWDMESGWGMFHEGMAAVGRDLERHARRDMANLATWANILAEEVGGALQESMAKPANLRAELVQVAAVAIAAIEAIDRKAAGQCAPAPD